MGMVVKKTTTITDGRTVFNGAMKGPPGARPGRPPVWGPDMTLWTHPDHLGSGKKFVKKSEKTYISKKGHF